MDWRNVIKMHFQETYISMEQTGKVNWEHHILTDVLEFQMIIFNGWLTISKEEQKFISSHNENHHYRISKTNVNRIG